MVIVLHLQKNNPHHSFPRSKPWHCAYWRGVWGPFLGGPHNSQWKIGVLSQCGETVTVQGSMVSVIHSAAVTKAAEWEAAAVYLELLHAASIQRSESLIGCRWAPIYRSIGCKVILKPNRHAHQLISTLHRKFGETRHKEKVITSNNLIPSYRTDQFKDLSGRFVSDLLLRSDVS